mgnify:CR=1 FL=1
MQKIKINSQKLQAFAINRQGLIAGESAIEMKEKSEIIRKESRAMRSVGAIEQENDRAVLSNY